MCGGKRNASGILRMTMTTRSSQYSFVYRAVRPPDSRHLWRKFGKIPAEKTIIACSEYRAKIDNQWLSTVTGAWITRSKLNAGSGARHLHDAHFRFSLMKCNDAKPHDMGKWIRYGARADGGKESAAS